MFSILTAAGLIVCFIALIKVLMGPELSDRLKAFYVIGSVSAAIGALYSASTGSLMPLLIAAAWIAQVYITAEIIRRMGE